MLPDFVLCLGGEIERDGWRLQGAVCSEIVMVEDFRRKFAREGGSVCVQRLNRN